VCDGAAPNLTVVKSTHGYSGAYNVDSQLPDQYEVRPFFINPFNAPHLIHWLICPSHQVNFIGKEAKYIIYIIAKEHDKRTPLISSWWNQEVHIGWPTVWMAGYCGFV